MKKRYERMISMTNMTSNIDIDVAIEMRDNGATYEEIGKHFGVSKQRVHTALGSFKKNASIYTKIRYKGLKRWFKETDTSFSGFAKLVGTNSSSAYVRKIQNWLTEGGERERTFTIEQVKKMLEVTGMTFEELFEEDERE